MGTKMLEEALSLLAQTLEAGQDTDGTYRAVIADARAELAAVRQAAKNLDRMAVGDFTYSIRDRAAGDPNFTGNTWEHPDVKAWSDASETMRNIAKEEQ